MKRLGHLGLLASVLAMLPDAGNAPTSKDGFPMTPTERENTRHEKEQAAERYVQKAEAKRAARRLKRLRQKGDKP
jgi:hypothetical protein